ncbi:MAG: hypothetical protein QOI55_741, partial [Actinomycetota bacterium]|nr:hypothetical protein [Actinomycetota bacterium]
ANSTFANAGSAVRVAVAATVTAGRSTGTDIGTRAVTPAGGIYTGASGAPDVAAVPLDRGITARVDDQRCRLGNDRGTGGRRGRTSTPTVPTSRAGSFALGGSRRAR